MPDHEEPNARGLFGGVFARGGVEAGDTAWLQAMLDAEAGLARALERAGLAPAGSGEAVTAAARAENFDPNELGELAALTGNPVPGLARALARQVPQTAVSAVHRGATSQDILDTAAMLLAKRAIERHRWPTWPGRPRPRPALAEAHRSSIMIGRTLLQQAVPVTFGLVAAGWLTSLDEAREGLAAVARSGWPCSSAARRARSPRWARPASGSPRCSPRNSAWRCPCCPGTPTGCGSSTWAPPWPGSRRRSARSPGTSRCWPSRRSARSARAALPAAPARGRSQRADPAGATAASPPRRGGSSAMPHKHNPVASIAILGCTRQVPGLLATLVAASRTGAAARGRRLARRVGAADRPAPADRLGLELGGRAAARAGRGHLADGRQPGRDQGPAARRARRLAAGRACSAAPRRTTWWPRRARGR